MPSHPSEVLFYRVSCESQRIGSINHPRTYCTIIHQCCKHSFFSLLLTSQRVSSCSSHPLSSSGAKVHTAYTQLFCHVLGGLSIFRCSSGGVHWFEPFSNVDKVSRMFFHWRRRHKNYHWVVRLQIRKGKF